MLFTQNTTAPASIVWVTDATSRRALPGVEPPAPTVEQPAPVEPCPWCGSTGGEYQEDWEPWPRCRDCGGN